MDGDLDEILSAVGAWHQAALLARESELEGPA
jgi:hypothetical protein